LRVGPAQMMARSTLRLIYHRSRLAHTAGVALRTTLWSLLALGTTGVCLGQVTIDGRMQDWASLPQVRTYGMPSVPDSPLGGIRSIKLAYARDFLFMQINFTRARPFVDLAQPRKLIKGNWDDFGYLELDLDRDGGSDYLAQMTPGKRPGVNNLAIMAIDEYGRVRKRHLYPEGHKEYFPLGPRAMFSADGGSVEMRIPREPFNLRYNRMIGLRVRMRYRDSLQGSGRWVTEYTPAGGNWIPFYFGENVRPGEAAVIDGGIAALPPGSRVEGAVALDEETMGRSVLEGHADSDKPYGVPRLIVVKRKKGRAPAIELPDTPPVPLIDEPTSRASLTSDSIPPVREPAIEPRAAATNGKNDAAAGGARPALPSVARASVTPEPAVAPPRRPDATAATPMSIPKTSLAPIVTPSATPAPTVEPAATAPPSPPSTPVPSSPPTPKLTQGPTPDPTATPVDSPAPKPTPGPQLTAKPTPEPTPTATTTPTPAPSPPGRQIVPAPVAEPYNEPIQLDGRVSDWQRAQFVHPIPARAKNQAQHPIAVLDQILVSASAGFLYVRLDFEKQRAIGSAEGGPADVEDAGDYLQLDVDLDGSWDFGVQVLEAPAEGPARCRIINAAYQTVLRPASAPHGRADGPLANMAEAGRIVELRLPRAPLGIDGDIKVRMRAHVRYREQGRDWDEVFYPEISGGWFACRLKAQY